MWKRFLKKILFEFPVKEISINLPGWIEGLPRTHWIKDRLFESIKESIQTLQKLNQVDNSLKVLNELEIIQLVNVKEINLGEGTVNSRISSR